MLSFLNFVYPNYRSFYSEYTFTSMRYFCLVTFSFLAFAIIPMGAVSQDIPNPPECGADFVVSGPALHRNGARLCFNESERVLGCRADVYNNELVLAPEDKTGNRYKIPLQSYTRVYGGLEDQGTLLADVGINTSIPASSENAWVNKLKSGGVSNTAEKDNGSIVVEMNPDYNSTYGDEGSQWGEITPDAASLPLEIGELQLEMEIRDLEDKSIRSRKMTKKVNVAMVNMDAVSSINNFVRGVGTIWNSGKMWVSTSTSLIRGNILKAGSPSPPWELMGRLYAWEVAQANGWSEEATSKLTVASVAKGIGGFAWGIENIGNNLITKQGEYKIEGTSIILRVALPSSACQDEGGPPPRYRIPAPAPDYLNKACLRGDNFGFNPPDPRLIVHKYDANNDCRIDGQELQEATSDWAQNEDFSDDELDLIKEAHDWSERNSGTSY